MSRTICSTITGVLAVLLLAMFYVGREIDTLSTTALDLGRPLPEAAAILGQSHASEADLHRLLVATGGSAPSPAFADPLGLPESDPLTPPPDPASVLATLRALAPSDLESVLSLDLLPASTPTPSQTKRPI